MTNVLFIIHDNYQDSNQFPLGPAYLASVLEQNGYTVEVYCMDVFHYTNDDLANKLKKDTLREYPKKGGKKNERELYVQTRIYSNRIAGCD